MEERTENPLSLNELVLAMADMQEGLQPDLSIPRVILSYLGEGDLRSKTVLSCYLRREMERRTSSKDQISVLLKDLIEGDDELSLKGLLESIYHLPFRSLAAVLRDMAPEITNSFGAKNRTKGVVRASLY
jgi:hypothetical protein